MDRPEETVDSQLAEIIYNRANAEIDALNK